MQSRVEWETSCDQRQNLISQKINRFEDEQSEPRALKIPERLAGRWISSAPRECVSESVCVRRIIIGFAVVRSDKRKEFAAVISVNLSSPFYLYIYFSNHFCSSTLRLLFV